MKAILIFLRHLADYIAGITFFILMILSGFLAANSPRFVDADTEVKTFVWVVVSVIVIAIYLVIAEVLEDTRRSLDPTYKVKNKYKIDMKWGKLDGSVLCIAYTIDHNHDHILLTMDNVPTSLPVWTSIIVTKIE